mmetsp:Transcript_9539/g.14324  ORF Transcript_9539/g.14324 Transcript_9539/m.14324 type:complete len:186 (+) Transcript_9539:88-645(+)|eukprot:CAMPEP_0167761398 /NCGR_PEP_ID=MMETSP0110_2-20121227/12147_1 /TAXON_ID=629695 /ORGANISM="Gymnochlora sp., Strain CCMP2014" /LENGTH=185 /DNA_ID=CAMNT_0007648071 /DNA_START=66 /DNA_END=623 /DNA_ORIENTATION=-
MSAAIKPDKLKKGMIYIHSNGTKAKITQISKSKTGKHGHGKYNVSSMATDSKKKLTEVVPSSSTVNLPMEVMWGLVAKSQSKEISGIFTTMDKDKSGKLDVKELSRVISAYDGSEMDAKQFMSWYDCKGKSDGTLCLQELEWYLGEIAWEYCGDDSSKKRTYDAACFTLKGVVKKFQEISNKLCK